MKPLIFRATNFNISIFAARNNSAYIAIASNNVQMKPSTPFLSFLFFLLFQNTFAQEYDLKTKASELGYDDIMQLSLSDKYYSYKNDLQGILDENFQTLLPTEYSLCLREGTELIRLKNTAGLYSLYNLKESKVVFEDCNWVSHALTFNNEDKQRLLFEVHKNGSKSYAIYSSEGQLVISLPTGYTLYLHNGSAVGVFVLSNNTQTHFLMLNEKGTIIADYPLIFQPIEHKDYFIVRKDKPTSGETIRQYGLINHQGEFLYDLKYQNIAYEKEFIVLRLNDKITILDANLNPILKSKPGTYAEIVEDRFFLISKPNGMSRLYNLAGKLIMEHKAKKVHYYGHLLFRVTSDKNEVYFIDHFGNKVSHKE